MPYLEWTIFLPQYRSIHDDSDAKLNYIPTMKTVPKRDTLFLARIVAAANSLRLRKQTNMVDVHTKHFSISAFVNEYFHPLISDANLFKS